ncbi:hypothetical protein [Nioella nitratireducens]|nr:hypothetical protein [Nioella nitratireducens]
MRDKGDYCCLPEGLPLADGVDPALTAMVAGGSGLAPRRLRH